MVRPRALSESTIWSRRCGASRRRPRAAIGLAVPEERGDLLEKTRIGVVEGIEVRSVDVDLADDLFARVRENRDNEAVEISDVRLLS